MASWLDLNKHAFSAFFDTPNNPQVIHVLPVNVGDTEPMNAILGSSSAVKALETYEAKIVTNGAGDPVGFTMSLENGLAPNDFWISVFPSIIARSFDAITIPPSLELYGQQTLNANFQWYVEALDVDTQQRCLRIFTDRGLADEFAEKQKSAVHSLSLATIKDLSYLSSKEAIKKQRFCFAITGVSTISSDEFSVLKEKVRMSESRDLLSNKEKFEVNAFLLKRFEVLSGLSSDLTLLGAGESAQERISQLSKDADIALEALNTTGLVDPKTPSVMRAYVETVIAKIASDNVPPLVDWHSHMDDACLKTAIAKILGDLSIDLETLKVIKDDSIAPIVISTHFDVLEVSPFEFLRTTSAFAQNQGLQLATHVDETSFTFTLFDENVKVQSVFIRLNRLSGLMDLDLNSENVCTQVALEAADITRVITEFENQDKPEQDPLAMRTAESLLSDVKTRLIDMSGNAFAGKEVMEQFSDDGQYLIMNAARPLLGHTTFEGAFSAGVYYAVINLNDQADDLNFARQFIEQNIRLDARVILPVTQQEKIEVAIRSKGEKYAKLLDDPELEDAVIQNQVSLWLDKLRDQPYSELTTLLQQVREAQSSQSTEVPTNPDLTVDATQSQNDLRGFRFAITNAQGDVVASGSVPAQMDANDEQTKVDYYKAMADQAGGSLHISQIDPAAISMSETQEPLILGMTWQQIQAKQQGRAISQQIKSVMPEGAVEVYSSSQPPSPVASDLDTQKPEQPEQTILDVDLDESFVNTNIGDNGVRVDAGEFIPFARKHNYSLWGSYTEQKVLSVNRLVAIDSSNDKSAVQEAKKLARSIRRDGILTVPKTAEDLNVSDVSLVALAVREFIREAAPANTNEILAGNSRDAKWMSPLQWVTLAASYTARMEGIKALSDNLRTDEHVKQFFTLSLMNPDERKEFGKEQYRLLRETLLNEDNHLYTNYYKKYHSFDDLKAACNAHVETVSTMKFYQDSLRYLIFGGRLKKPMDLDGFIKSVEYSLGRYVHLKGDQAHESVRLLREAYNSEKSDRQAYLESTRDDPSIGYSERIDRTRLYDIQLSGRMFDAICKTAQEVSGDDRCFLFPSIIEEMIREKESAVQSTVAEVDNNEVPDDEKGLLKKETLKKPSITADRLSSLKRIHTNSPREHDVTEEEFLEKFGMRGVQYGNWVTQAERQSMLNLAYDSFSDMAQSLDLPERFMGFNGRLAIAFGARGRGGRGAAAAHYEPSLDVINMTKHMGAGALAHEWAHALDKTLCDYLKNDMQTRVETSGFDPIMQKGAYFVTHQYSNTIDSGNIGSMKAIEPGPHHHPIRAAMDHLMLSFVKGVSMDEAIKYRIRDEKIQRFVNDEWIDRLLDKSFLSEIVARFSSGELTRLIQEEKERNNGERPSQEMIDKINETVLRRAFKLANHWRETIIPYTESLVEAIKRDTGNLSTNQFLEKIFHRDGNYIYHRSHLTDVFKEAFENSDVKLTEEQERFADTWFRCTKYRKHGVHLFSAYNELSSELHNMPATSMFYDAAIALDGKKKNIYWSSAVEIWARGFSAIVHDALSKKGIRNDYATLGSAPGRFSAEWLASSNPEGEERSAFYRHAYPFVRRLQTIASEMCDTPLSHPSMFTDTDIDHYVRERVDRSLKLQKGEVANLVDWVREEQQVIPGLISRVKEILQELDIDVFQDKYPVHAREFFSETLSSLKALDPGCADVYTQIQLKTTDMAQMIKYLEEGDDRDDAPYCQQVREAIADKINTRIDDVVGAFGAFRKLLSSPLYLRESESKEFICDALVRFFTVGPLIHDRIKNMNDATASLYKQGYPLNTEQAETMLSLMKSYLTDSDDSVYLKKGMVASIVDVAVRLFNSDDLLTVNPQEYCAFLIEHAESDMGLFLASKMMAIKGINHEEVLLYCFSQADENDADDFYHIERAINNANHVGVAFDPDALLSKTLALVHVDESAFDMQPRYTALGELRDTLKDNETLYNSQQTTDVLNHSSHQTDAHSPVAG